MSEMSHAMAHILRSNMRRRTRHSAWGWLLWPFKALFWLIASLIGLVGRFVAILLGFILFVVGALVSLTIIGAIVGIPLALFGLLLMLKGIF